MIPADVPQQKRMLFEERLHTITRGTQHIYIGAADHKLEHRAQANIEPELFFKIAQAGGMGALATQLGLIARYAGLYPEVAYIGKLTGKTDLVPMSVDDPLNGALWDIEDALALIRNGANIIGVGVTVYLGSRYERDMLAYAAKMAHRAHQEGLLAMAWVYPRGVAVTEQDSITAVTYAASVSTCLGMDIVKVHVPLPMNGKTSAALLPRVVSAAGNTKVVVAGGERVEAAEYLAELYEQMTIGGIAGSATGRNIFERPFEKSVALSRAISDMIYRRISVDQAVGML